MLHRTVQFFAVVLVTLAACAHAASTVDDPPRSRWHSHAGVSEESSKGSTKSVAITGLHVDAHDTAHCGRCLIDAVRYGIVKHAPGTKVVSLMGSDQGAQWPDVLPILADGDPDLNSGALSEQFAASGEYERACYDLWRRPVCGRKVKPTERAPPRDESTARHDQAV